MGKDTSLSTGQVEQETRPSDQVVSELAKVHPDLARKIIDRKEATIVRVTSQDGRNLSAEEKLTVAELYRKACDPKGYITATSKAVVCLLHNKQPFPNT